MEQTLDWSFWETKNRTEIHTHLFTTVQWQNQRIPQILESYNCKTTVEWDDLVWKATAAYNFFPTESSGNAPFFLMFGWEAAVKHILLASESQKYLGTDDSMINI